MVIIHDICIHDIKKERHSSFRPLAWISLGVGQVDDIIRLLIWSICVLSQHGVVRHLDFSGISLVNRLIGD